MVIDCDSCIARPRACGDCVVTHLLSVTPVLGRPLRRPGNRGVIALDDEEVVAVATLTAAGLLPPLRLVPRERVDAGDASTAPADLLPADLLPVAGSSQPVSRSVAPRLRVVHDMPSRAAG